MTDLPVCRLCGCDPAHYPLPSGEQKHHCATRECTLHCVLMTSEQWNALMGVDRDAVRYRWLRDNRHLGIWFSVGNSHMSYAANIDTDIDEAMGEQQ